MTKLQKGTRRFLFLLAPLAVLAAAADAAAAPVTAGGVTVDVVATQNWGSGHNGAVRVQNVSFAQPITSFRIGFTLNGSTIQLPGWNGTISSGYTARNADWLQWSPIQRGGTWEEGFSGIGTWGGSTITSITINGQNIPIGGGGDTTPPSVSLTSSATSVTQPATITLSATATDASGIAQVEFFDGASRIGTDTTAPYSWSVALTAANNGSHSYTARATDASANANVGTSAPVSVSVNIQQTSDFALSASPASLTVNRSASGSSTISVSRTNFTSSVSFSVGGLPSGVTASFSPSSTTGNSTVLTLTASSTATTGNFNITVTGAGGGLTRTATIALTVGTGGTTPNFTLSATPTSVSVPQGGSATANLAIARTNFTSAVAFSATGMPAGVTVGFNPTSTTTNSSTVTFTAAATAATGTSNVTITGTGGGLTRTVVIALTVTTGGTTPNFTLAATPTSLTVTRGTSGTSTIAITRTNFTSAVAFTNSAPPSGVTVSYNPQSATGSSTIVTFAVSSTAAAGLTNITITGSGGGLTRTVVIALTVSTGGGTGYGPVWAVANGRVTKDGVKFPVHCGSWFGLQGRYEPAYDSANPRGAPMEQYVGNTFWAATHTRTVMQTMNEIKQAGITVIRLPLVHQTLSGTDPQGDGRYYKNYSGIINDATYPMRNSREALESMIKAANAAGIAVMLDIHSCSNYIDWRKGRLDARPPWADATRDNYDFKREEWSCASTLNPSTVTNTQPYNETLWLQDLRTLAGLGQQLGVTNIIGIDIFNEPWDYTWSEWKTLTERAYQAISAVNPNLLIFVQGISGTAGNQDGSPTTITQTPHGDLATNPNWGENLFPAGDDLPNVPITKLVWSPHTYGPSVFVQKMFADPAQPECAALEGDAFGDARCNIVINSTLLRQGWEEHFGYLRDLGYAMVVGEFGGNMDWPGGTASLRDQQRFGYLTDKTTDAKWQNAFVDYMVERDIEGCYWSINPESGDTGGWYGHAYDPVSNTGGWGEWRAFDSRKTTLLNRHWSGVP